MKLIYTLLILFTVTIASTKPVQQGYNIRGNYVVVDFSKPSTEKRFIIYSPDGKELYRTYVAHGRNSGGLYATKFSNKIGSKQSSLGTYKITGFYYGQHGKSARLAGLSKTNSNARQRLIVVHSANYIGGGKTGRSDGCFAIPEQDLKIVYSFIGVGSYIYATN